VTYVLVAIFGAAGAVSRYWVDGRISELTHGQFPWGTFVINVVGAFALGLLVALTTERLLPHPNWRVALGIGYLGSFTTFSTYAYESVKLAEDGAVGLALVNSVGMLALGMLAAFTGLAVGRTL
jgi:fluoride exporter